MATRLDGRHPRDVLDAASAHETIVADPTTEHTLTEPLAVTTPGVTLRGLRLRLDTGANENLIEIGADGVSLTDFRLDGTRERETGDRHSNGVLITGATNVTIRDGVVENTTRHGIRIADTGTVTSRSEGNVVRVPRGDPTADVHVENVLIESPRRDGCSVEGPAVRNVTVRNVRTFDSSDRGGVEVKDGASDALVTGCYAENCVYGVAVQDHGGYSTGNVRILGNTAVDCETVVDAQTSPELPPEGVVVIGNTGREIGGAGMGGPGGIYMHCIEGLVVANNLVDGVGSNGITVHRCEGATVGGNVVRETEGAGIVVIDSPETAVSDNHVESAGDAGIDCRGEDVSTTGLRVTDNRCVDVEEGIALDGTIDRYLIATNLLDEGVVDGAEGSGLVTDNLV